MKKIIFAVAVCGLLNSGVSFAQGAAPAAPAASPDDAYLAMVDQAMLDVSSVNWAEMRKLYAKSSFYSDFKSATVSSSYYNAGKSAAAAPMMRQGFKDQQRQQFANFNSHVFSLKIAKELPSESINPAQEQKELEAIADSIIEGADGSSPAKAYTVVSEDEEKLVVETFLQQKISKTTPTSAAGHKYDVISYTDAATQKPMSLYFNIDLIPPKPIR